jgi:integrase
MPLLLRHAMETEHQVSKSPFVISRPDGSHITRSSFDSLWNIVTARTASKKYPLGSTRCAHNNGYFKVTLDFHVHPHLLRHTYITQLFEAGLDIKQVQYLAGHSTPAMTLKVYTHYRRKQREQETADQVNAATAYMGWQAESNGKVVEFKPEATTKNNTRLQAT